MRIVAGSLHGRRLIAPRGDLVRPTSARLREALFNVLMHAPWSDPIETARVLDAFAGTGALGLEALSRGAQHASFMERDPRVREALTANVAACGMQGAAEILARDATHPPQARDRPANLVFLDPPYDEGLLVRAFHALREAGWIAPGALIVAETSRRGSPEPLGRLLSDRLMGAARASFWRAR